MSHDRQSDDRGGRQARGSFAARVGVGGGDGATGADRAGRRGLRRLRRRGRPQRPRPSIAPARRCGGSKDRGRRKKGAPLRLCSCGRKKGNRGPKQRRLMTAVGQVAFTRRYWKCTCGQDGSYAADELLGVSGQRYTKSVRKHCCRLAADASFASTSEHLHELLGVDVSPETTRAMVEGHGRAMARFQAEDQASEQAFREAKGEVEFTTDAGKVNTREEGWKDLKIAVIAKREAGEPTAPDAWKSQRLPAATLVLAFAMIATAKEFRKSWRPRLRRLGVTCWASVQVLADGASWIWKAVGRVLTGCVQTLDFYHACQHLSRCAEGVYGEGTAQKAEAYRHARGLLLQRGWAGVCQWVSELLGVEEGAERERRRKATD